MNLDDSAIFKQLKDTCKLTKSRWVAIIEPAEDSWLLSWEYGLSKPRKKFFNKYLEDSKILRWLNQVSKVERIRWRKLGEVGEVLGCERIYAIPNTSVSKIIIVGADSLDSINKKYFNVLSHGIQSDEVFKMSTLINLSSNSAEKHSDEFSHEPEKAFYNVLQSVNAYLTSDGGYLAVRSGDRFQVEALMGKGSSKLGAQILIEENEALARIVESRKGLILQSKNVTKGIRLGRKRGKTKDDWLIVPLLIGNRVTGIMAFYKNSFTISGLERATILAGHVAPVVEKTMIFREASHHLQNIGLLNELASVVSVGLDLKEVTQRVHRMLQRAFSSGQAELLLVSSDGKRLINADRSESSERPKEYDISATFVGLCVESGKAVRTGSVENETRYTVIDPETRSKLAVPLKFRDEVKGVLALESNEPDAFSKQEEKFLLVIASQITALIENARLNEQTVQRADRLAMINDLVQQVVGLTDQMQIAQRAATLMQNRPWFEMVVISLLDESRDELVTMGVAGTNLPELPKEMRTAKDLGIAGKVLKSGVSELILDTSKENKYFALPGWEPGSALCVALREGDNVFGIINVESQKKNVFTDNDLLTLEALAGVLSSVLIYARRYDELESNVAQLEAVRETSLDLSTDLDLNILLKRVVNRVRELVDARGAEVGLIDEDKRVVQVLVSENPWQDYTGYTFPLMTGVAGRVAALGEPLVVEDYNAWSGKGKDDFKAPFTTVAGVPLILSGETIGTLSVQDDRPDRSFGSKDIQVLELIAPQITVFIRNARLYQELADRMEAQRLAEARLIRSARLAAVGEMAAGVAHELNNPLTTVAGFTELVLEELPEDFPHRDDLELVLSESRRARGVVRRLLDFSRQGDILRTSANVNDVISDVLALVHHLARTSGVIIQVELWDDLPEIQVDRDQMQQVFLNLVHNAIQAMPNGGDMIIQSAFERREKIDGISVVIEDSGKGIAADELPRIFEPFFTTKPSGAGTGLGLSISYGIVTDHGGIIDVESEPKKGTKFTVWLPINMEMDGKSA